LFYEKKKQLFTRRYFMSRGIKKNDSKTVSSDNINEAISYSGPERRIKDSPEFFGYFSLECIERRQTGYSLLRPLNGVTAADL
jgi:hypothetical protein